MNIFLLNQNVELNAQSYVDSHVKKIPIEINQMLATAISLYSDTAKIHKVNGDPYRPCFHNHPCTRWISQSQENFTYAIELSLELCQEYYHRYGKTFGCRSASMEAINFIDLLPKSSDTDRLYPVAANSAYLRQMYVSEFISTKLYMKLYKKQMVTLDEAVIAYRAYYKVAKPHLAVWTNRPTPQWY